MDVKREKELDERRKNEKLEISEDHPIRKLLARMRERHGTRIMPSSYSNDIERGRHDYGMSRTTSTQSIMTTTIDETNPNALQQAGFGQRTPLFSRRNKSPMMRGKTMDDGGEGGGGGERKTGRMDGGNGNGGGLRASFGDRNGRSSALSHYGGDSQDWHQVKREIQYMFEGVNDKFSAMQKFDSRLANIERLLQNLAQRQPGGKPEP
uniref:Uncharacterized protein n=1 Tax=Panagrolaimus sp. ES5 TaxID=591445 RepID=A0AC34GCG3_9BILA